MHCISLWHVPIDMTLVILLLQVKDRLFKSSSHSFGRTELQRGKLDEVKSQWREFGVALGFSIGDLDAIEEEGLRKPGRCIQSLLGEWSRKRTETYHWNGLISALFSAGIPDLATRVTRALSHKVARQL